MEELDLCGNSSIQMPLNPPVMFLVTKILVKVLVNQKSPPVVSLLPKKILKGPSELKSENLGAQHMK